MKILLRELIDGAADGVDRRVIQARTPGSMCRACAGIL
jgi:hypothetical protein